MLEELLLIAFFILLWRGVDWLCREWEAVLDRDIPMTSTKRAGAKPVSSTPPVASSGNANVKANHQKTTGAERGRGLGAATPSEPSRVPGPAPNNAQPDHGKPNVPTPETKQQPPDSGPNGMSRLARRRHANRGGGARNPNTKMLYIP
jgi:hypothetical protein